MFRAISGSPELMEGGPVKETVEDPLQLIQYRGGSSVAGHGQCPFPYALVPCRPDHQDVAVSHNYLFGAQPGNLVSATLESASTQSESGAFHSQNNFLDPYKLGKGLISYFFQTKLAKDDQSLMNLASFGSAISTTF